MNDGMSSYIFLAIGLIVVLGFIIFKKIFRQQKHSISATRTSVLLSYYTKDSDLTPVGKGTVNGLRYWAIAGLPTAYIDPNNPLQNKGIASLIYIIELPFKSKLHLVGIPKRNDVIQIDPTAGSSVMEKVVLEGDYQNYFTLYAEKGMQVDSRYTLDPSAMNFTVDFCQSHNWEILGDELYFVQATPNAPNDPTYMNQDIGKFIEEIKPAVAEPLNEQDIANNTPYQEEYKRLKCPICQAELINKNTYYTCKEGHGVLLRGGVLSQVAAGEVALPEPQTGSAVSARSSQISCPSCGKLMEQTPYENKYLTIDTCTNCPYRWLDPGELVKN